MKNLIVIILLFFLYGCGYTSIYKDQKSREIFNFKLANNIRLKENTDLPKTNQIGAKTSNIFSEITINPNEYFNQAMYFTNNTTKTRLRMASFWANKPDKNPLKSLEEALILASIIENEGVGVFFPNVPEGSFADQDEFVDYFKDLKNHEKTMDKPCSCYLTLFFHKFSTTPAMTIAIPNRLMMP